MSRDNNMRDDEINAIQRFENYLKNKSIIDISWKPGNPNVPPDFYLNIGNESFVVEVTTLGEHIETSNGQVPILNFLKARRKFTDEVENEVKQRGILNGLYIISFSPHLPDFFHNHKLTLKLKSQIIRFIETTQNKDSADETIEIEDIEYLSIRKYQDDEKMVEMTFTRVMWMDEITNKMYKRFVERVDTKKNKYLQRNELANIPKILILVNQFTFTPASEYKFCISNYFEDTFFHTIFMIDYDSKYQLDCILYTQSPQWG